MEQPNINKKYSTNKKTDGKADNEVDEKAHLEQSDSKQEIISGQA